MVENQRAREWHAANMMERAQDLKSGNLHSHFGSSSNLQVTPVL